jgi:peptidyl-dipeptidase Dcp
MSRRIALFLIVLLAFVAAPWAQPAAGPARAQAPAAAPSTDNPLLKTWTTPFQVPPFQEIKPEHFLPAFKEAVALNRKEIDAIVNNPQPATFANTIEAL